MANVARRPFADIAIDGLVVPRLMSGRVSKGLNQNYSTYETVEPFPYPPGLRTWSSVVVTAGGDRSSADAGVHFAGHFLDPTLTMWVPRGVLACGSALARAENWVPPFDVPLNSLTDIEAVEFILDDVGIYDRQISGHGMRLGTFVSEALTWKAPTDALTMLQQIDTQFGLGYRTFDTGTTIVRQWVPLTPVGLTPVYSFEEGVNCINGGFTKRRVAPAGTVTINGDGVSATSTTSTTITTLTPYTKNFMMIQQEAAGAGIVSAADVAIYTLARLTRSLVSATVYTWVDRIFAPGQVVFYKAEHLMLEQNFFVQQVITSFEGAQFRQRLELIGELDERTTPSGYVPIGTVDPGTMTPVDPLAPLDPIDFPPLSPPTAPQQVTAAITITAIDYELIIIDDAEVGVWFVKAVDASVAYQGTITARAWTASGPVLAGWETGTGPEFITAFTALSASSGSLITLEVTTSLGATASVTRDVGAAPGVVKKTLELFLAGSVHGDAWDPSTSAWNVDPQDAAAAVVDVANGPAWTLAEATNDFMRSLDYLETSATENTIPFTDGSTAGVRCWIEPDVDAALVGVIGTNGQVAVSTDRGATWTVHDGPGGTGLDIVISRFVAGQVHVLTSTGYHVSDNYGASWRTIRLTVLAKWLTLSHTRNMITRTDGAVEVAESGTPHTGPGNVVTLSAHIREDRFVALTADGHVWQTDAIGSDSMEDLGAIVGTPVHSYRNGSIADFYAYAAGVDGAFKLIIRVNAGPTYEVMVLQIRKPGVGNSDPAADYSRIGVGQLVDATTPTETSPPGSPGACVGSVVPLVYQHNTAMDKTTHETRTQNISAHTWTIFAPNQYVVRAYGVADWMRSEDGLCTTTTGTPSCGTSGAGHWAWDAFHSYICFPSGPNVGVWASSDGENYTQLPGGTVGGVGPRAIAAGRNRIWMLIGGQVYYMPLTGGTPSVSGYNGVDSLDGALCCPRDDDSYCIISYTNIISGNHWLRITGTATVWSDITSQMTGVTVGSPLGPPNIASIDGTTWVGGSSSGFIRSTDGGQTWSLAQANAAGGGAHPSYSDTQSRWWTVGPTDGGLPRVWWSEDDGASWTSQTSFDATGTGNALAAVGNSP